MLALADALDNRDDLTLTRFRSESACTSPGEIALRGRRLWGPWWRRGVGPAMDSRLPVVDVVHVAGRATPPTTRVPLIISVDDLRPLRSEARTHQRVKQLQRALDRGARLVASSHAARHEVQEVLGLDRQQIYVVRPPIGAVLPTVHGRRLVVSVTGQVERFFELAPAFVDFATRHQSDLVVVASSALASRIRASGIHATVVLHKDARQALRAARVVVHMSDGARFPSFAIAALTAGVPTLARATEINRELLSGASALLFEGDDPFEVLEDLWSNEARRSIAIAAGLSRAVDFSAWTVASAYAVLYGDVVRSAT